MESELNMNFNILRPKKVSGHPACMVNFLQSENTQIDRQTITKRHYDRKHIRIQTVIPLNMYKNLENMHNRSHKL